LWIAGLSQPCEIAIVSAAALISPIGALVARLQTFAADMAPYAIEGGVERSGIDRVTSDRLKQEISLRPAA
jgi:hypothetical protein